MHSTDVSAEPGVPARCEAASDQVTRHIAAAKDAARAKDETELKQAEGGLTKAQLEGMKNDIVFKIDAEKANETLEDPTLCASQRVGGLLPYGVKLFAPSGPGKAPQLNWRPELATKNTAHNQLRSVPNIVAKVPRIEPQFGSPLPPLPPPPLPARGTLTHLQWPAQS